MLRVCPVVSCCHLVIVHRVCARAVVLLQELTPWTLTTRGGGGSAQRASAAMTAALTSESDDDEDAWGQMSYSAMQQQRYIALNSLLRRGTVSTAAISR